MTHPADESTSAWDEPMVDGDGEIHGYKSQGAKQANADTRSKRSPAPASASNMIASMTLMQIDAGRRPNPETVCEGCKASVWMASTREVRCYCRILHRISWESIDPQPLTHCDGVAIAEEDAARNQQDEQTVD